MSRVIDFKEFVTLCKVSRHITKISTLFAILKVSLEYNVAGWSRLVAYLLGSQEVAGSKPAPAPKFNA